jgi:translation elongation factor EF-1alpha
MAPLFDLIVKHFQSPVVEEGPFRMLVTTIEANPFLGRVLTGRVRSGSIKANQSVKALSRDGKIAVLTFHGVPDIKHPWVNTDPVKFAAYMQALKDSGCKVVALRDLARYLPPAKK